jgi:DNA-binding NarL/FixJ family response regulator
MGRRGDRIVGTHRTDFEDDGASSHTSMSSAPGASRLTASDAPTTAPVERVLLVDDHALLAQSLSLALRAGGVEVVRSASLAHEGILRDARESGPHVVLLDLDLGEERGTSLPIIPALVEIGTRVVMMTGVTDEVRLAECVEAGAVGIIDKSQPFEELLAAVHRVVTHGELLDRHQRQELLAALRQHRVADRERLEMFARLTPREAEVLAALMDGKSAEQIAKQTYVSITTVRTHIRSTLSKLGVNSQLAAVALARRADWRPGASD